MRHDLHSKRLVQVSEDSEDLAPSSTFQVVYAAKGKPQQKPKECVRLYRLASGLFSEQCEDNVVLQGNEQDLDLRQDTNASIIQGFTMAYIYASTS